MLKAFLFFLLLPAPGHYGQVCSGPAFMPLNWPLALRTGTTASHGTSPDEISSPDFRTAVYTQSFDLNIHDLDTNSRFSILKKIKALEISSLIHIKHFEREQALKDFKQQLYLHETIQDQEGGINTIISFLKEFSRIFQDTDAETKFYFAQATRLAKKIKGLDRQIKLRYTINEWSFYIGPKKEPELDCLEIIRLYSKSKSKYLGDCYYFLSKTNRYSGNFTKALYYALESIKEITPQTPPSQSSRYYGELGEVYQELGEKQKSIDSYRKTIALREQFDCPLIQIFRTAGFIADQLIQLKRPKEALGEINSVEKRHRKRSGFDDAIISQIKANCFVALGENAMAEKYFLKMLGLFNEKDPHAITSLAKYDAARFYVDSRQYQKAAPLLAGFVQGENPLGRKKDILLLEFKIDSAAGNYISSIKKLNQFIQMKDSLFNEAKSKQIEELKIKFETKQNSQALQLLKQENTIQQSRSKQAADIRNITLAGIFILFLFLLLLYSNLRQKQKNNIEITKKNDHLNKLLKEKEWLVREVHHRVKNNLQIVMGLLHNQLSYIDNEMALTAINSSERRMHSIALIHQKLYQNETMSVINMPDYITELVDYLKDSCTTGTHIIFYNDIENIDLDVSIAVPLGLIMNESITNIFKYAFNQRQYGDVHISLKKIDGSDVLLEINDNGVGLPADLDINNIKSLGMNLIRGLSKQIGGKFTIESNNGVKIKVVFKDLISFSKARSSR